MTLANRKTAREALKVLVAAISEVQVAYDYIPNALGDGQSPVATVSSWSANPKFLGSADDNTIEVMVTFWVLRRDDQNNDYEAAAEDEIDVLAKEIGEVIETWDNAAFSRSSETGYQIMDGRQYRTESHFVIIEHWQG